MTARSRTLDTHRCVVVSTISVIVHNRADVTNSRVACETF